MIGGLLGRISVQSGAEMIGSRGKLVYPQIKKLLDERQEGCRVVGAQVKVQVGKEGYTGTVAL